MVVLRFSGVHAYLDQSLALYDLRGRNVLLNAVRWASAMLWNGKSVGTNVIIKEKPNQGMLQLFAYLVAPARIEEDDDRGVTRLILPSIACRPGEDLCELCGRSGAVRPTEEGTRHVAEGMALDAPCLAARLAGRVANNAAMAFVVSSDDVWEGTPSYEFSICKGDASIHVKFYRHESGGREEGRGDVVKLVFSTCNGRAWVTLFGFRRLEWQEKGEEEKKGELLKALRRIYGVEADVAYQPPLRGPSLVPQLSVVNAWGELYTVDVESLAALSATNTLFYVRFDVDRFGDVIAKLNASLGHCAERELARLKSEISALVESNIGALVVYVGGDENMFIAAADTIVDVVEVLGKVRDHVGQFFREHTGSAVTISASVVAARVKLPAHLVADILSRGLDIAKSEGRNRLYILYLRNPALAIAERRPFTYEDWHELRVLARKYSEKPLLRQVHTSLYLHEVNPLEAEALIRAVSGYPLYLGPHEALEVAVDVASLL